MHGWLHGTLSKVPFGKKRVCYRRLNAINFDDFRHDVSTSFLEISSEVCDDLDGLVGQYNKVLLDVLEKYAPLRNRTITLRPRAPWYNEEIDKEKRKRRKLERRWRSSRLTVDHREIYAEQCSVVKQCIFRPTTLPS